MRRLRYKIRIDYPTVGEFRDIFKNVCIFNKIDFNDDGFLLYWVRRMFLGCLDFDSTRFDLVN